MTFDNRQGSLSEFELKCLRITAGVTSFIGIAGIVALMAQGAMAADPTPTPPPGAGFNPGARGFTNPFSNVPPGGAGAQGGYNYFEDDEEEDEDFAEGNPPAPAAPAGRGKPGGGNVGSVSAGGASSSGGPSPTFGPKGVTVGGGTPGGVIERNQPRALNVNEETGEGSKEIVTDFNFPDADIMDIAKTLGKLTGKNFIMDKDVKGRITIISNAPITVGDAWKAFLTALDINGFALIPSGKYIRIARQRDARDKQLRTYTGDSSPDTDALITRVFVLKYINAEEVARTFRSFMPANSRIIPYEQTNTVIVTDTGSNIAKLSKMLEILDVEGYDAGIEVIPVKYASAVELSKLIDTLLPGTGGTGTGAPPGAPRFGGGGGKFTSRRTKEGGIINTIIADERTNTLIVHANTRGADQARELVAKLDLKQPAQTGGGRVHVVYLQFADAEAIGSTLNNLSQSPPGGFRPAGGGGGGTGANPVASSLFEGAIKVSPDKSTNSLVITASPGDFVTVQRVINRLDIPRDEVYVEAVVMEVIINRNTSFSANIVAPSSLLGSLPNQDLFQFIQSPFAQTGALLGFAAGKTVSVPGPNGTTIQTSSVQGLIKALQTSSNTNVLATPQIIALDNAEAIFESTDKIPVPVQTAVQGAGVSTSIQKENITLSIKIKPQINKVSNFVKLDTEIKLGDIAQQAFGQVGGLNVFATLDRSTKTTVVVGDGDTLVIGGLIRDKVSESTSKIPILGDIPVLGWLFKAKNTQVDKTNLLVFLTPHIVRQYDKVREILDRKLKERDEYLEKNAGGEDFARDKRDAIIRSLPDLKDIEAKRPDSTVILDDEPQAAVEVKPEGSSNSGSPAPQQPALPQGLEHQSSGVPPVQTAPVPTIGTSGAAQPPLPTSPANPLAPPTAPAPAGGTGR